MDISAFSQGVAGIQNGMNQLRRDADTIARSGTDPASSRDDATSALVNLKADEQQVAMSVKVVKAADDALGTLLDVMA